MVARICRRCGELTPAPDLVCGRCGEPLRSAFRWDRVLAVALVVGVATSVAVAVLAFVPLVSHPFSTHLAAGTDGQEARALQFPHDAEVRGSWSSSGAVQVLFQVHGNATTCCYSQTTSSSGTFSFESGGDGWYQFVIWAVYAPANVSISGTYSVTVL